MKILVAGGAGFIGCNFLRYMLNKYPEYNFVCIDNFAYSSEENIGDLLKNANFKFIKEDITNAIEIDKIFDQEKFDCVVNFAAEVAVDYSIKNPNQFVETNILGTAILMNACLKHKVSRYHQISTDEVYGDLPLESTEEFDENAITKPSNPYAATKAAADLLALSYYRTYNLGVTISRSTNNYGPYQSDRALIPLVIKKILNKENIPLFGKGLNVRDWLYVKDHAQAIDLILHQGKLGEIYNISGNSKLNNRMVIDKLLSLLNGSQDLITYVADRPGHDLMYSISSKKLEDTLNWKRQTTFDEGISKTVDWYQKRTS